VRGRLGRPIGDSTRLAESTVGAATMNEWKIKRALISVYDKTGVVEFARALQEEFGIEIISTGGTASLLTHRGIPVTRVEEITGVGEMLDGRVKTLHPKIHAAILADRDNPDHMRQLADAGIEPIDMVVVNLYPFEETIVKPGCTFEQAIEMIDIGGPCLLRATAKNHRHVLVETSPESYESLLEQLRNWDAPGVREGTLKSGAVGAFMATAKYDAAVVSWLTLNPDDNLSDFQILAFMNRRRPRYGENPHQRAQVLQRHDQCDTLEDLAVSGLEDPEADLSFNNYVDADAALELCSELTRENTPAPHACVFVKHTNPCGVGFADDPTEAYRRAYLGDPNAAMGGVLACNFEVTPNVAESVMLSLSRWGKHNDAGGFFIEVWIAPAFDDRAVEIIRTKKTWGRRVRLLHCDMDESPNPDTTLVRSIAGGVLMQTRDLAGLNENQWKVVTKRQPADGEMNDLRLAWLVAKHTKSNAVSICRDGMLIGNGAGQTSRVMSCRLATWLAKENRHAEALSGAVAASDGFFPFRDGPDILIDAGVTAIIQPGGSKRDAETIAACNERRVAMVMTNTRHFRH
jgi:phosphoribosylaminoimidazolecarboxamide formyltransferase/IMP cyclohydrolase